MRYPFVVLASVPVSVPARPQIRHSQRNWMQSLIRPPQLAAVVNQALE
jgi:hypothetical protein